MTRLCVAASLVALPLAAAATAADQATPPTSAPRHVYAIAVDSRDLPVTDLTAADFVVKEDGRERQVTSAAISTAPLQIVIIVDDNGTGIFRYGLTDFAQRLQGRGELALRVVVGQVRNVLDYTTSFQAWMAAITGLGVRPPTPEGGQLLEGVSEAAKELRRREAQHPVILALTVGGEEHSTLLGRQVLDQLHESRAALHVIFAGNAAVRSADPARNAADLLDRNLNLSQVLGDGPKQSGGRRRDVIATQAVLAELQQVAREITAQYGVTYLRPVDGRTPQRLQVTVTRRGVTVVAPTRAPAR
jgi:hypothetical protein